MRRSKFSTGLRGISFFPATIDVPLTRWICWPELMWRKSPPGHRVPDLTLQRWEQKLWLFGKSKNNEPNTATTIKREVRRKLKTLNITCWNSLYDSRKVLNDDLNKKLARFNMICLENNLSSFNQTDKEVITEYLAMINLVVTSLDKLQSEKETYTRVASVLLPTCYILRTWLETMRNKNLKYPQPLLNTCLTAHLMKKRDPRLSKGKFSAFFNEMDFFMATAINPCFKLPVVCLLNP